LYTLLKSKRGQHTYIQTMLSGYTRLTIHYVYTQTVLYNETQIRITQHNWLCCMYLNYVCVHSSMSY